jgi:hypothetical protein
VTPFFAAIHPILPIFVFSSYPAYHCQPNEGSVKCRRIENIKKVFDMLLADDLELGTVG